jgi:hypothetical protein
MCVSENPCVKAADLEMPFCAFVSTPLLVRVRLLLENKKPDA